MTIIATENRTESMKRHLYGSGQEPVQQGQDSRWRVSAPRVALRKEAVGSENSSCVLDMTEGSPSLQSIPSQKRSTASAAGIGLAKARYPLLNAVHCGDKWRTRYKTRFMPS